MMTSTTGHRGNRGGRAFTLLELVAVMLLVCTVLAMAAPSLSGFARGRRTADAAGNILALTNLARTRAVTEARLYRLNIDTDDASYYLTAQQEGAFVAMKEEHGRIFYLPDDVSVALDLPDGNVDEGRVSFVQFYPDGRSDEASIELAERDGGVFLVECPSPTERFRVVRNTEKRW